MAANSDNPDIGRSLFRSPSLLIVGRLGASALALISSPIVARAIGPEGRGETAAAMALFLIVPVVVGFGLPLEVRRQAATSNGHSVVRTARLIVVAFTVLAIGIATLAYYTVFSNFDTGGRAAAAIGVALTPLSASWAIDISVLVAHRRYAGVLTMQILEASVTLSMILVFWMLGLATVATVLVASITGTVATFLAGLLLVRVPLRGDRVNARCLLRNGLRFVGGAIAEIGSFRADQVIALPLIGAYQAGLYSVAVTIGSVPLAIGHALAASYFSPIAQESPSNRKRLQSEAVRAALSVATVTIPVIAIIAWAAIPLVFGSAFSASRTVTVVSLMGSAAMLVAFVASMALAADGQGGLMTIAQVVSLVCGVAGLLILGPAFGAVGAAIASGVGYFALLFTLLAFLRIPVGRLVPRLVDFPNAFRRLKRDQ